MKPDGKNYEEPVIVPHVWEEINQEHHLVTEKVSKYIRELESEILRMRLFIAENIKAK